MKARPSDARRQAVYLGELGEEVLREAARTGIPASRLVRFAWQRARAQLQAIPVPHLDPVPEHLDVPEDLRQLQAAAERRELAA